MAEAVGAVRIDLFANLAQWVSGLDKAEGRLDRFAKNVDRTSKNIIKAGNTLTVGLTAPIVAFAGLSIRAAAEAQDLQGAFNISFGNMAEDATNWAKKTGDAMGRSTQTIQKTAIGFQQLFEDIAPTEESAAELSMRFTELSEDYASFANVSSDQAFQALSGGLAGAGKALKRLGIDISDAALEQEAMRLGIAKTGVELTNQQKVLARAGIIMNGFAKQSGEIARSQGETEEDTRRTREEFDELLITVGDGLLPVFNQLLKGLRDLIAYFNGLSNETKTAIGYTVAFAAAAGPVVVVIGNAVKVFGIAGKALGGLGLAFVGAGKGAETFVGKATGAVLRLTALAGAAYAVGAAIGSAIKSITSPDLGQEMIKAQLAVANLQKVGLSAEEARQAVKYYYAELAKGNKVTEDQAISYGKFAAQFNTVAKDGAAVADATNAAADANMGLDKTIADLIKGIGDLGGASDDTNKKMDAIRAKLDPIGTALKTYKQEVALAVAAGYTLAEAQKVIGKEFIDGIQSVDGWRDSLSTLPPEIQKVIAAQDALAIRQNTFADNWKKLAEQRVADADLAKDAADQAQQSVDAIRDYGAMLTDQFDPMAVFTKRMQWINDAFRLGAITADVYAKEKAAAFADTPAGEQQVKLVGDLTDAFTDAALGAGDLGESIKQMILDSIKANAIKPFFQDLFSGIFPQTKAITGPIGGAPIGGGFDIGGLFSQAASFLGFGGTRDKGGDGKAGVAYDVGSGVREKFIPDTDGKFVRGAGAPDSGGVTFIVNANDPNEFRHSERQMKRRARRELG